MRACGSCKAEPSPGALFCGQCGLRLGPEPDHGAVAAASWMGPAPAAALLRRSERKVVTVLFADVKGSLALVAGQDPEGAGEVLAAVVATMGAAVRRHGGLVNQVMGDGIMALFGAPLAMEDHAGQACLAALALRIAVEEEVRPRVHVRVGLGSGEVVVRAVSGDIGLHYSAAGEAVHMASRMEQAAAPGHILLTDATRQLAGSLVEVRRLDGAVIPGVAEAPPVFELIRMRPSAGVALRQPGSLRLVGRERELDVLRRARDRAAAGEGQAVRLVGDAGSGKSRLMREFTGLHLPDGWTLCQAEAVSHRRTSYGVVSELLARLFGLAPDDGAAVRRDKVEHGLQVRAAERGAALAPLAALLGLEEAPPEWTRLDAWERRERTIGATVAAFGRLAAERPLALVVEDAHWLDAESAASIQRVGATAEGRRLLSVVTERAGHGVDGGAWREARWQECQVRPLDEAATVWFLRSRLLPGPDVAALERKLVEHTRGNPLFLEECLQALVDEGTLLREGERFRLVAPVSVLRVPTSLRGLLDARVDRLADTEKDVLQAASVVGSTVPLDLLRGVSEVAEGRLEEALGRLVEAGFLVAERGAFAFRHGLIREAAYSGILKRSRVRMHAAVLGALERRDGSVEPMVDLLANHAVQAEAWPKAAAYARAAAQRAYGRYANPEAVHYYDQAVLAAGQFSPGSEQEQLLLELHLGARWPLFRLGAVAKLGPHLDETVRLAGLADAASGGHEGVAQALVMRSHVRWLAGDCGAALADAARTAALAEERGDRDLAVRARFQRGLVALAQADVATTLADMAAVADHMEAPTASGRYGLDIHLVVTALSYAARAHAMAGDLPAARVACDRALALAGPLEQRLTRVFAHIGDGVVALAEGRAAHAIEALQRADELCRGADVRLMSPVAAQFLAKAHVAAGQVATALPIARQAVEDAERMGFLAMHPQRLAVLAETLLAMGEPAEETARAAVALARQIGEKGAEAAALGVLAAALRRAGRDGTAEMGAALTLARQWGLAPLVDELGRASAVAGG